MKKFIIIFNLIIALFPVFTWGQYNNSKDKISVYANILNDSLLINITTDSPNTQMSFLMQGTHISLSDSNLNVIALIELPNAKMVRGKIKHHPNEVKAMHNQQGKEVRPDLLPLISALNDTSCLAYNGTRDSISCLHLISLNKNSGVMTFEVRLPNLSIFNPGDSVKIEVSSSTTVFNIEYNGRKLSEENRMPPEGLGQALTNKQDTSRNVHFMKIITIGDSLADSTQMRVNDEKR